METTIELLRASPALLIATVTLFGLIVGSFLNVVIHRLPRMMKRDWCEQCAELLEVQAPPQDDTPPDRYDLLTPASTCPSCGHRIRALENIPIVSWLLLRGRCASCDAPISARYPLVEAATGIMSALVAWQFGASAEMLLALLITWTLIALALIDYDTQYLPDSLTLPLLWLALLVSLWGGQLTTRQLALSPESAIIGAAVGYLSLWSVYMAFKLLTGKEGMGEGDFKLLAGLCAWLGWPMLIPILILSAGVGSVVGIALMASGVHERGKPIPFGPFLAAAGWLAMLSGDWLVGMYLPPELR
jgi:leader peptidase (prepilin peptidase)/N-methyltransferase